MTKAVADLDKFFAESKPAALPQVTIPALPKLEEIVKPARPFEVDSNEETTTKKLSRREKALAKVEPEDRLRRTVFVGNLPVECCKNKAMLRSLKKKFATYGKLVSIRFRSVGFSRALPRKIAFATQQFHEERNSCNAYIVMEKEEEAREAVKENACLFEGHHLRVDVASTDRKNDTKKSIFIGNLPLNVSEEAIWEFFSTCGIITNVRVIRDKKTNLGKGFGYVSFSDKASIELALQLAGTDCAGRPIRIAKCTKEGFHKETQLYKQKKKEQTETGAKSDSSKAPSKNKPPQTHKPTADMKQGPKKPFRIVKPTERHH